MHANRHLDWPGSYNMRDLGGLPTHDGHRTAWAAVVRGDSVDHLTDHGWSALRAHGITTIVDLRHDHEHHPASTPRPPGVTTVRVPLDDTSDTGFWRRWGTGLDCTPLYYPAFLDRFPQRLAHVIAAIVDAPPGGVLVHCAGGRDRTGLVTLVLLAAVGVPAAVIAADYALSAQRLQPLWRARGLGDQDARITALLTRHGTTATRAVISTVSALDAPAYLRRAGLTTAQLRALRARLLDVRQR